MVSPARPSSGAKQTPAYTLTDVGTFGGPHDFLNLPGEPLTRQGAVISAYIGTCRLTPRGYVRTTYDASEVDAFGLYCAELDECYLIPLRDVEGQSKVQLRLTPAANGQAWHLAFRAAKPPGFRSDRGCWRCKVKNARASRTVPGAYS